MSRALNLDMTGTQITKHCHDHQIAISVLENLPDGGVRLVCSSARGADQIRAKLKKHIIQGDVRRARIRPRNPLW